MDNRSRTYQLIEERLGSRSLRRVVTTARGDGPRAKASWAQIAHDLAEQTGVLVSPETLRQWFADVEAKRLAKNPAPERERAS